MKLIKTKEIRRIFFHTLTPTRKIANKFGISVQELERRMGIKRLKIKPLKKPFIKYIPDNFIELLRPKGMSKKEFIYDLIRKRDKNKCRVCGLIRVRGKKLHVHHHDKSIAGKSNLKSTINYWNQRNLHKLVTLCDVHHVGVEFQLRRNIKI